MRITLLHKKDIVLNKDNLKKELNKFGMNFSMLFDKVKKEYGLDIEYKSFMSLIDNRSSWKLLYAYAIIDVINADIDDIFDIVDVDIDKKIEEKKRWNKKYNK